MSYEIKRLDDYPAIVTTFNEDFDASTELELVITEMRKIVSAEATPIYVIMNLLAYNISLNDLFAGTSIGMKNRNSPDRTGSVEKTIKTIIITEQRVLKASLNGFEHFGLGKNLEIASSLDEALQNIKKVA